MSEMEKELTVDAMELDTHTHNVNLIREMYGLEINEHLFKRERYAPLTGVLSRILSDKTTSPEKRINLVCMLTTHADELAAWGMKMKIVAEICTCHMTVDTAEGMVIEGLTKCYRYLGRSRLHSVYSHVPSMVYKGISVPNGSALTQHALIMSIKEQVSNDLRNYSYLR